MTSKWREPPDAARSASPGAIMRRTSCSPPELRRSRKRRLGYGRCSMEKPVSDEVARARWLTIGALRLGGVAMVVAGMLGTRQVLAMPMIAAYALIAIGLLD